MLNLSLPNRKKIRPTPGEWHSAILKDKAAVSELFREISPKIAERPGGYTRILKTGNRVGDNAEMCILELVDYNEAMLGQGEAAKTKTTRRRRSAKKKTEAAGTEEAVKEVKAEKTEKPAEDVKKIRGTSS